MKKKAPKLSSCEAKTLLESRGVDFSKDFYALRTDAVQAILDVAKMAGYRQPKNANGSKARYFHARVDRATCKKR